MITTPTTDQNTLRVYCDPARNCVVTSATLSNGEPESVWRRMQIELQPVENGLEVPREIFMINTFSRTADRVVISDIEVNPKTTDGLFDINFPMGTCVEDGSAEEFEFYKIGPDESKLPWPCGCATRF